MRKIYQLSRNCYSFGVLQFTLIFSVGFVLLNLQLYLQCFVDHCLYFCPFLLATVYSVFLFTAYYYLFDNFKLFLEIYLNKRTLLFIVIFHFTDPPKVGSAGLKYHLRNSPLRRDLRQCLVCGQCHTPYTLNTTYFRLLLATFYEKRSMETYQRANIANHPLYPHFGQPQSHLFTCMFV